MLSFLNKSHTSPNQTAIQGENIMTKYQFWEIKPSSNNFNNHHLFNPIPPSSEPEPQMLLGLSSLGLDNEIGS